MLFINFRILIPMVLIQSINLKLTLILIQIALMHNCSEDTFAYNLQAKVPFYARVDKTITFSTLPRLKRTFENNRRCAK